MALSRLSFQQIYARLQTEILSKGTPEISAISPTATSTASLYSIVSLNEAQFDILE